MSSDKLDELAANLDDVKTDVEDLQFDPDADVERLDEVHQALQDATDTIDEIGDNVDGKE
jgi:hypothetical protein